METDPLLCEINGIIKLRCSFFPSSIHSHVMTVGRVCFVHGLQLICVRAIAMVFLFLISYTKEHIYHEWKGC